MNSNVLKRIIFLFMDYARAMNNFKHYTKKNMIKTSNDIIKIYILSIKSKYI